MNETPRHFEPDDDAGPAPREPVFNMPAVVVALIVLNLVIHIVRVHVLDPGQDIGVILRAAFIPVRYSGEYLLDFYAFTSPLTYSLLHGSYLHLGINMVWLAAFGSPLANRLGVVRFLAFWAFTALAAVGLHYLLHPLDQTPLVGASGAISGMMGAAARFGFMIDRRRGRPEFVGRRLGFGEALRSRMVVTFLAVWFGANFLAGAGLIDTGDGSLIAWEAHIGGFLAGFLCVGPFDRGAQVRSS